MFPFFTLDTEACLLLGPGSELVTPSKGQTFESGARVLVSEDNVNVRSLLLIVVHQGSEAAPLGVGVGALEWDPSDVFVHCRWGQWSQEWTLWASYQYTLSIGYLHTFWSGCWCAGRRRGGISSSETGATWSIDLICYQCLPKNEKNMCLCGSAWWQLLGYCQYVSSIWCWC